MATLTAWTFDTPEGADEAEQTLVGLDDDFIDAVREKVTPGTSALFVLSSDAVLDRVREAFAGTDVELIHTNLSGDEEARLREVFTEAD